ncbi:pentapeptide repeat-containing protein [Erwinia pyrifoliae]|uniref:pentapeptide repeat-containing protein n=1 Tax=Erwinia pyrifoliae TaxID=79967 RepID=UPI0002E27C68|nr:pentapeptide repeat-containing protein [Erwinia pyrifoliae]
MISPLLYLTANILKKPKEVVRLANKSPTVENIEFANKILNVEAENALFRRKKSSNETQAQARLFLCMHLLDELESITINKAEGIHSIVRSGFLSPAGSARVNIRIREKFTGSNLSYSNLKNKDLRSCDFRGSNEMKNPGEFDILLEKRPDFSGSTLDGVDLSDIFLFNPVFKNASMIGAKFTIRLTNPFQNTHHFGLCDGDFTGTILDKAVINLHLPSVLSLSEADWLLNDYGPHASLFHMLKTISREYSGIKTKIIKEIVNLIVRSRVDINLIPFVLDSLLNNIASENCYLDDGEIYLFFKKLVENVIENADKKVNLKRLSPKILSSLIKRFDSFSNDVKTKEYMIKCNGFFIQLMAICTHHEDPELVASARETYNKYLQLDAVKPFTAKTEFGNSETEPDWSDRGNFNFILINGHKTMIIDHENLCAMLHVNNSNLNANWNKFFLYENNKIVTQGELNHEDIFFTEFRIFKDEFQKELSTSSFKKLIEILDLGIYRHRFESTLSRMYADDKDKIKTAEDMRQLTEIFEKVLTYTVDEDKNYLCNLEQAHFEKIIKAYGLSNMNHRENARILFSLATLFTRYSSKYFLGAEFDSPKALRDYANALMHKANLLDPQVTGGNFDKWNNALIGSVESGYERETCTYNIHQQMFEHAEANFPAVLFKITPPGWR